MRHAVIHAALSRQVQLPAGLHTPASLRRTYEDDAGRQGGGLLEQLPDLGLALPAHAAHNLGGRHAQEGHPAPGTEQMGCEQGSEAVCGQPVL